MPKILLLFLLTALSLSCVSSKKYKLLESENFDQKNRIRSLEIAKEKGQIAAAELADTKEMLGKTENLVIDLNSKYNGLQESYDLMEKSYEEVLLQNAELLDVTSQEKTKLTNQIKEKQNELDTQERLLREREEKINESEAKITSLEDLLSTEKLKMDSLQTSISNALFVFGPSDLSVIQKDGKIYVSLSQKLLFSKGSDAIDAKGESALSKLAEVLKERNDINIVVEGHTDPDGTPERNWDLSTKRATSVVKLLQSAGCTPESLTASGKGFYDPLVENDSEENKSLNRRTEIILSPKLDRVIELIRNK